MREKQQRKRDVLRTPTPSGPSVEALSDDDLTTLQLKVASHVVGDPLLTGDVDRRAALRELLDVLGLARRPAGWHPERGTIFGYWWHVHRDETPCNPCWNARTAELEKVWGGRCPLIP